MKLILNLLFALLFLLIGLLITGIFLPSSYKAVSIRDVQVRPELVYSQVNNLKNWENWWPWYKSDSSLKAKLAENYTGKGGSMIWESAKTGNCSILISHSVPPESVGTRFEFGSNSQVVILFYFEPVQGGTRINSTLNVTGMNLWERYFSLFQKEELANLLDEAIDNLRTSSSQLKYSRVGEVKELNLNKRCAVIKPDTALKARIDDARKADFAVLDRFFERRNLQIDGPPFCIYYNSMSDSVIQFACGYPIKERTWVWQNLKIYEFAETHALLVSHFGGRNLEIAHLALESYAAENGLKKSGGIWEEYSYNPVSDMDTSMWETKVYMPVE